MLVLVAVVEGVEDGEELDDGFMCFRGESDGRGCGRGRFHHGGFISIVTNGSRRASCCYAALFMKASQYFEGRFSAAILKVDAGSIH